MAEAVFARQLSTMKHERLQFAQLFNRSTRAAIGKMQAIAWIRDSLYTAKMICYARGFALLQAAAKRSQWQLDLETVALLWQGGCLSALIF